MAGIVALVLVGAGGSGWAAPAAPVTPAGGDPAAVAAWPAPLRELVAGTDAFAAAPWFSAAGCASRGGDVSLYINTFFKREADFRRQLTADLLKADPKVDRFGVPSTARRPGDDQVFPNGNRAYDMEYGVCAADLRAWATPDRGSPWGFAWAARPDPASLTLMATHGGGGGVDPAAVCLVQGSYLCSRAFFVDCDRASPTDRQRCLGWNVSVQQHLNGMAFWIGQNKSIADRVGEFLGLVGVGLWTAGAWASSGLGWVLDKVGDAAGWLAKKGMEQVVAFFTSGAVWLWGQVMAWMVNSTTPNLGGGGFVATYNLVSGLMLAMAFLVWLAGLVTAWRRGRLAGSVLGAGKAILGVQLVGIIAFLMLALANDATLGLIHSQQRQLADAQFTTSIVAVNPVVGLVAAVLAILGLLGAALVLVFQAPLTLGHALFGTVAAAGQAHPAGEQWMGRWFVKLLSLAWCKFFMVGMTVLAQNLLAGTRANAAQNVGQQLFGVLSGLLLMLLLPTTPWLLSAVMSFTVGHASAAADRLGQHGAAMAGRAAAALVAPQAAAAGAALAGAAGGSAHAVATMGSNLAALGAMSAGTFPPSGGSGSGGAGAASAGGVGSAAAGGGRGAGGSGRSPGGSGSVPGGGDGNGGNGFGAGASDGGTGTDPAGGGSSGLDGGGSAGEVQGTALAGAGGETSASSANGGDTSGAASGGSGSGEAGGAGEPPPDPQDADLVPPADAATAATAAGAPPAGGAGQGSRRGSARGGSGAGAGGRRARGSGAAQPALMPKPAAVNALAGNGSAGGSSSAAGSLPPAGPAVPTAGGARSAGGGERAPGDAGTSTAGAGDRFPPGASSDVGESAGAGGLTADTASGTPAVPAAATPGPAAGSPAAGTAAGPARVSGPASPGVVAAQPVPPTQPGTVGMGTRTAPAAFSPGDDRPAAPPAVPTPPASRGRSSVTRSRRPGPGRVEPA